ncbi:hypothetical protein KAX17_09420 [Candidatus Bipolaricaulota bacterium]|nr:hypothetical protein [Candidatus Bipolaricaulota bacterium]
MILRLNPELSRKVWKLAYPIILANLSLTLLNVVDTAMLGRLSPAALAAAGIGGVVYLTVVATLGALSLGTQALTARRHGEKEMAQCGQVLDNSLALALILGGVFTLLSSWLAPSPGKRAHHGETPWDVHTIPVLRRGLRPAQLGLRWFLHRDRPDQGSDERRDHPYYCQYLVELSLNLR